MMFGPFANNKHVRDSVDLVTHQDEHSSPPTINFIWKYFAGVVALQAFEYSFLGDHFCCHQQGLGQDEES